ncbi:dTDP-4-dehydrorhamnose reductase [Caballeronia sordidicola]|uniref:dTDP-4-dehydrorhamnose reductase n=1 Tax=Caballeronia sordidicola TaxID=196367 RepID=A0A226X4J0_CABSO|nr:dTDP-4-dehydrorhamnose reductase [Caballeronia sordidicola]OXC77910.1 dTDP-4-dehydrorhamnose reductase [Caballeronia sordidicola]
MGNDRATPVILVTGSDGQVGFELMRSLAHFGQVTGYDRVQLDLARPGDVRAAVRSLRPKVIVNAGAYTAVDRAESEPELAHATNAEAPRILAEEAEALGALLVHYSTDYVFDGLKEGPYVETDEPNPLSVYGRTKLEGDRYVAAATRKHIIFRTAWAFGVHGSNFPKSIIRAARERSQLSVVDDQLGAPTSASLLADITALVVSRYLRGEIAPKAYGLYNLTASGETTRFDYAYHVLHAVLRAGLSLDARPENIKRVNTDQYPSAAPRPRNSRLDTTKLQQSFGLHLPTWEQGIDHMLAQMVDVLQIAERDAAA